ncbi:hypothetical protein E3T37_15320 [Cryobacterium sp. TMT2-10]|uniref:Uncharacterized protein n=1 Tax=Cryobacterium shii TaxID=1259235 RepID=A0AAQ2C4F4_9MICO|nr:MULTISPECIES: hypothetical protein [Cryobacterium]TFC42511.1 hypothetical protein E3O49_14285 [Cryobacterium shii]TFD28452.1 hypothetical protein E3T32_00880 [Cryobacterium sp. TMT2-23]TFD35422.1 hypothetical protein E3T37_15320 [Cryobacterium sp. TMT2-10]
MDIQVRRWYAGSVMAWAGILIPWSALVVSCTVLLGRGAHMTLHFEPTGEELAEARTGNLLILGGSIGLFVGAGWARLMHVPLWACILVAIPAALVGGLTFFAGNTLFPQLSYFLAVPIAATALISVLILARPVHRAPLPPEPRSSNATLS